MEIAPATASWHAALEVCGKLLLMRAVTFTTECPMRESIAIVKSPSNAAVP